MIIDVCLDIAIILVLMAVGALIARRILGARDPLAYASLAFPLGGGGITWMTFLLSWFIDDNLRISIALVIVVSTVLLAMVGSSPLYKEIWEDLLKFRSRKKVGKRTFGIAFLFGLSAIGLFILSVGRSYSVWDAVAFWSLKGYGMAVDNSFHAYAAWGAHGFTYPANIPLLISIFKMVTQDALPGSKLLFPLYYFSVLLGSYRFWKKMGLGSTNSRIGILFLATTPIFLEHATIGYSNLPFACFLILGILWGIEGIHLHQRSAQLMSSVLFGLASWTRPEGIYYSMVALGILMISGWIVKGGKPHIPSLTLPILLISGTWLVFYGMSGAEHSQAMSGVQAAVESWANGQFNGSAAIFIAKFMAKNLLRINIWGVIFPLGVVALLLRLGSIIDRSNPIVLTLFACSAALAAITWTLFYVGQFQYEFSFLSGWLSRGFARELIPAGLLTAVTCVYAIAGHLPPEQQTPIAPPSTP